MVFEPFASLLAALESKAKPRTTSARLDLDTPMVLARITCCESGDYNNAEVIDMETEQMIFSIHGRLCERQAVSEPFADFFKSLGVATLECRGGIVIPFLFA